MLRRTMGQFDPFVSGVNNTAAFAGLSTINPWNFILMLEGTLTFAVDVARRLQMGGARGWVLCVDGAFDAGRIRQRVSPGRVAG